MFLDDQRDFDDHSGWKLDWSALSILDGNSKRLWVCSKYFCNCWVPKLNIITESIPAAVRNIVLLEQHGCNAAALVLIDVLELVLREIRTVQLNLEDCAQNVQWWSDLPTYDDRHQRGIAVHKCCLHCSLHCTNPIASFSWNLYWNLNLKSIHVWFNGCCVWPFTGHALLQGTCECMTSNLKKMISNITKKWLQIWGTIWPQT